MRRIFAAFFVYVMFVSTPANAVVTKMLAACLMLASQTYDVPPSLLVGIYKFEDGQMGGEYKVQDDVYLGAMKINKTFIPELAHKWDITFEKAYQIVRDDPCTNVAVAAWYLRGEINRTRYLTEALMSYYERNHNVDRSSAVSLKVQTLDIMRQTGLLRTVDSLDIQLKNDSGVHEVTAKLNNKIEIDFILDTGATDVSIPADVFLTLLRTNTISDKDILPSGSYSFADGSVKEQKRFIIRQIQVGSIVANNIEATVSDMGAPLLLGQSFLKNFGNVMIDNTKGTLSISNPR